MASPDHTSAVEGQTAAAGSVTTWRCTGRKVRTPKGSAPGNPRSGRPEGKWHRKYTARPRTLRALRRSKPQGASFGVVRRAEASKGEKVR